MKKQIICVLSLWLCFSPCVGFSQIKNQTPKTKKINTVLQQKVAQAQQTNANAPKLVYYSTRRAEQSCEQYPVCKKEMEKMYQADHSFRVMEISSWEYKVYRLVSKKTVLKTELSISYTNIISNKKTSNRLNLVVAYDGKPISTSTQRRYYNY